MIFHSDSDVEIEFELRGRKYRVGPGENVDIPDEVAYAVQSRGLPLVRGESKGAATAPEPEKVAPTKPVLPRGVELGALKESAKAENEDEFGDGPELEGDDENPEGDPVADLAQKLEGAGVDLSSLPGASPKPPKKKKQ